MIWLVGAPGPIIVDWWIDRGSQIHQVSFIDIRHMWQDFRTVPNFSVTGKGSRVTIEKLQLGVCTLEVVLWPLDS